MCVRVCVIRTERDKYHTCISCAGMGDAAPGLIALFAHVCAAVLVSLRYVPKSLVSVVTNVDVCP